MCAIAGVFCQNEKISSEDLKSAVSRMNESQARRGPDDQGILESKPVILANRRLSIIDLSLAGHQPMNFKTRWGKDLWLTFNGEIYNFEALRTALKNKGYLFDTKTDTEVILALYAEYGETSFSMLRGMFAFALWDSDKGRLFLVKDRYGIKPLYYFADNDKIVFASTVKALSQSGLVPQVKESKALISFLLFGSVPIPFTTIKGVYGLPAGHYLIVTLDKPAQIVKYYDALEQFCLKSKDVLYDGIIKNIKDKLEDALNLHLISDAPLGIFLSGGLDSSVIAALAAHLRDKPITTISIDFKEKKFSEKKYQDLVSQQIKSEHKTIQVTSQDFLGSFSEVLEAMDQPTIDGVNTFFVSQAAKKAGLKVVLSGLGGDEIFFGYPSFGRAAGLRRMQHNPTLLKSFLPFLSLLGDRYSKLAYLKQQDFLSFYLAIRGLYSPRETAKILNANLSEVDAALQEILASQLLGDNERLNQLDPADLLSYLEIKFYLQNQLLKDTDFMSMYHSIEVRVPFLDHPLVEYLSSLNPGLKLGKNINKPLLVEAAKDFLPRDILSRKKMGFTFPFAEWLKKATPDLISSANIPEDLFRRFHSGRLHWSRFWALYILAKQ